MTRQVYISLSRRERTCVIRVVCSKAEAMSVMAARPQETAIQLNETIQVVQRRHSMNGTMTMHTLRSFLLLETGQQSMGDLHLRLN